MKRFYFKNIKTKILLATSVPLVFLLTLGAISIFSVNSLTLSNMWVNHTYGVLSDADEIVATALDMEAEMRGYLLAGTDDFLDTYEKDKIMVFEKIAALKKRVSDNPKQVAKLGEVENILSQWQVNVAEPNIMLRREIDNSKTVDDLDELVSQARGKVFFDRFREKIDQFEEHEEELLEQRNLKFKAVLAQEVVSASSIETELNWVKHTYFVIEEADHLLLSALNMETGMRGYLLAGDESFLEPYHAGKKDFFANLVHLKEIVSDNPAQVKLVDEMEETMLQWRDEIAEPLIELRHNIDNSKHIDSLIKLIAKAHGKVFFNNFRQEMENFSDAEKILIVKRINHNEATIFTTYSTIIIGTLIAVIFGMIFAVITGRNVASPVNRMTAAMTKMAGGNLYVDIPNPDAKDEIGKMASAVATLRDNSIKAQSLEKDKHSSDARKINQTAMLIEMTDNFNHNVTNFLNKLVESSEGLKGTAGQLAMVANLGAEQSVKLNETADTSLKSVAIVSSTAEQFSSSIHDINQQILRATQVSRIAMDKVSGAREGIANLEKSSEKIGDIISLIRSIADQTNLLALNATIEAARAGDAGKGFAVVASEVKSLASQTASATNEIGLQISETQSATHHSVEIIQDVVDTISEMHEIASSISVAMDEQSTSMQNIVTNTHNATNSAKEVSSTVALVESAANNTQEASQSMNNVAQDLSEETTNLQNEITNFITNVTALKE